MKRTSVKYTSVGSYSHNPNVQANAQIKRNSCLVSLVGIFLILAIVTFILTHI
jgi:hypothetical protein